MELWSTVPTPAPTRAVNNPQAIPQPKVGHTVSTGTPFTRTGFGSQLHHDLLFHDGMRDVGSVPGGCKAHKALEHNLNPCFHLGLF